MLLLRVPSHRGHRQLSDEHEEILNAVGSLRRAASTGDASGTCALVGKLSALLDRHSAFEERGVFAELKTDPEFAAHVDSLAADHHRVHELLSMVASGDLGAAAEAERALRRHVDREENGLFPAAAVSLDGSAWARIEQRNDLASRPSDGERPNP